MVRKTTSQGKITIPKTAQTDQMFSHFQTLAYLMGAAKLPLMMPAMIARMIPTDRLDMKLPPHGGCHTILGTRPVPASTQGRSALRKSAEDYH